MRDQILTASAALTESEFGSADTVTTRDLRATLVHQLENEWAWRIRLSEGAFPVGDLLPTDYPNLDALVAHWRREERDLRERPQDVQETLESLGSLYELGARAILPLAQGADPGADGGAADRAQPRRVGVGDGALEVESGMARFLDEEVLTGGHTRGCTSWSFQVRDGDRVLNVVSACDLGRLATSQYPEQEADLERSFRVLRGLPVDIWVTCHARWWGRYRKFVASTAAKDPVEPFIDPAGYHAYIDAAEAELRSGRLH